MKLDKSKDVNDLHPINIPPISVISETSKLDIFIEVKDMESRNILPASNNFITPS